MIELDLMGRITHNRSSNLIGFVAILLKECANDMKEIIHQGGHGPVFVGEHPMDRFLTFPVGDNTIGTWYAKGIDF